MSEKIIQYFNQGRFFFRAGILKATIVYLIILAVLYLLNKTNIIKKRKYSITEGVMGYLLALYTMAILQITGIVGINGMQYHLSWFKEGLEMIQFSIPFVGSSALMVILNTVLFIPFGFLVPIVIKNKKWSAPKVLFLGFIFSFSIEFLQLFGGRFCEIDDLITNSVGSMIGYLIWKTLCAFKEKDTGKKAIIKGISIIFGVVAIGIVLIFVANGDRIQAERDDMYNEIGCSEEQYKDIRNVKLYNTKNQNVNELSIYNGIGCDISNGAAYYITEQLQNTVQSIVKDNLNQYVEIIFNNNHTFTFSNNEDLVLEEVQHILYNLNDGTIYYGQDSSDTFTQVLKYKSKEYPFQINENLFE